jgi:hypothetical protein
LWVTSLKLAPLVLEMRLAHVNNEITIKIPKGNYTLSDLEVAIAKELFVTKHYSNIVRTDNEMDVEATLLDSTRDPKDNLNDYWTLMDYYAKEMTMFAGDNNKPAGVADPNIPAQFSAPASQVAGMVTRWARRGEPQPASFLFDRGEAADVACKKSAVRA